MPSASPSSPSRRPPAPRNKLARKHGCEVDANRELVAIGSANVGAGLFQDLPEATLGAIVIVAVADMERIAPLARLWRIRRADFVLALLALFGVLIVGILAGLALAVGISLAVIVWRAGEGRLQLIGGRTAGTDETPEELTTPGLLVARPLQMLFFVNAAEIREAVDAAAASSGTPPDIVLLDLGLTPDLDVPAIDAITDLRGSLQDAGSTLWISTRVDLVHDRLERAGVIGPTGVPVQHNLLDFVRTQREDPHCDEQGRLVFQELEGRIQREVDEHDEGA